MLSAVLLNWKRPENFDAILSRLRDSPLVDEVIVWNNNPNTPFHAEPWVRFVNPSWDGGLRNRWLAGMLAKHDGLLIQDDDLVIPEATLASLYEAWSVDREVIHGVFGRKPASGRYQARDTYGNVDVVLPRCCILHRKYCAAFFADAERYSDIREEVVHNSDDIVMSYLVKATTGRQNLAHRLPVEELPSPHAISARPDHFERRTRVMSRCLSLGTKLASRRLEHDDEALRQASARALSTSDRLAGLRNATPANTEAIDDLAEKSFARYPVPVTHQRNTSLDRVIDLRNLVYDTHPIAVHACGLPFGNCSTDLWNRLQEHVFSRARQFEPDPDLTIVTWNNQTEPSLLERCLGHLGLPVVTLGLQNGHWKNHHKIRLTADALVGIRSKYVLCMDGFDALLLGSPRLILQKLKSFTCKLIFGAEEVCYPPDTASKDCQDQIAPANARWRYLNSGLWVGETRFIREFLSIACKTPGNLQCPQSDQAVFQRLLPVFEDCVRLDYRCELFQNLGVATEFRNQLAADTNGQRVVDLVESESYSPRPQRVRRPVRYPRHPR